MPLKIVFLRPQNWSRLKPYYSSTMTTVKALVLWHAPAILVFMWLWWRVFPCHAKGSRMPRMVFSASTPVWGCQEPNSVAPMHAMRSQMQNKERNRTKDLWTISIFLIWWRFVCEVSVLLTMQNPSSVPNISTLAILIHQGKSPQNAHLGSPE